MTDIERQVKEPRRTLVTGGAGFIGANLVRLLSARGHSVVVLDNLESGSRTQLDGVSHEFVEGDIRDADLLRELVGSCNGVAHLAAQTGVPGSLEDPNLDCEVNVLGTLNLLEACRKASTDAVAQSCPRLVFASSNAPLGRQKSPCSEEKAPLPISPYGASKLAGEAYCLAYEGSWRVPAIVLRFANVYGPFSAHKTSVVAKFLMDACLNGSITVDGDGGQTRDFIFVRDLCRAILAGLESRVQGEVFQIATGIETSILELSALVSEIVGLDFKIEFGPSRLGDVRNNFSAVSKAKQMLGWQAEIDLRSGLNETWQWFRQSTAFQGRRIEKRRETLG